MHKIEETEYGFKITVAGDLDINQAEQALLNLKNLLASYGRPFSLMVDLRELIPVTTEVIKKLMEIHSYCKNLSLERTAIIVKSPVLKMQGKQISHNSETIENDRYISVYKFDNWEERALAWVKNGIEPFVKTDDTVQIPIIK